MLRHENDTAVPRPVAPTATEAPAGEPFVPSTDPAPRPPRTALGPIPWWSAELLGAAALVLALPPWDLWPLAALAPPLFAVGALAGGRARWSFARATLAGLLLVLAGASWIAETDIVSLLFVAAVEAPLIGLFGALAGRCLRGRSLFPTVPALWIAVEALRMHWPDVGFAWLQLGHALAASPLLVQVADLGGVLLVGFVGACAGTALLAWRLGRGGARPSLAVLALALVYGAVRPGTLEEPAPGPLLVGIQPGFPQELKEQQDKEEERWAVCRDLALGAIAAHPDLDLLVFPETMWPGGHLEDGRPGAPPGAFARPPAASDPLGAWLAERAREQRARLDVLLAALPDAAALLIGVQLSGVRMEQGPDGPAPVADSGNGVVLVDGAGEERARYLKHILVPGGEKLPLVDMVPDFVAAWIERLVYSVAHFAPDLVPGPGARTLSLDGTEFGVTICFENAYGDYTRRFVRRGARFLVNLSNEGWFDTSAEFDHMQLQSVLRAVETRRAMFRSTNTGISCLVRPDGRVPRPPDALEVNGRDRAVRGVFAARVPLHAGTTLYTRVGDGLGWLLGAWVLVTFLRPRLP